MLTQLIGLINSPLTLIAVLISFTSALFICLPAHEFAHAHAAYKEGDLTSKILKRYTLSPFAHIDFVGFLLLIFFGIGFAKPVPINPSNFKRGKRSEIRVAIAGVWVNLSIGVIACLFYSLITNFWPQLFTSYGFISEVYYFFFSYTISLNFSFAFFNILPLYPLDGFRLIEAFSKTENGFIRFMKRFSFFIMLILLFLDVIGLYIGFFAEGSWNLIIEGFNKLFALIK